jgi:hypothetical protein
LGLSNWQMTQNTAFALHNKTGSDEFIAAWTIVTETGKFSAVPVRAAPTPPVRRDVRQTPAPHARAQASVWP